MPKEKNSAGLGDLAGGQRRARQLDHRADREVERDAGLVLAPRCADRVDLVADQRRAPARSPTSGIMISGCGSPPGLDDGRRPPRAIARACIANRPGIGDAEADPAQAEHRVGLVQPLHRVEQLCASCSAARRARPRQGHLDRQLGAGRAGTRAAAGRAAGSSPAGRPSPRGCSTKSSRCSGSSASRAACLLVVGLGEDQVARRASRRSPRNMCSVRHRPMPCGAEAPGPGRVLGGVGVGPHPQPARGVGVRHQPVHRGDQRRRRPSASSPSKWRTTSESLTGTAPTKTSPVVPSMEMTSPSRDDRRRRAR